TREIVVHGHDVNAGTLPRIPCHSRNRGKCLALARLHFRNATARECEYSAKLDIEHVLAEHARRDHGCDRDEREQLAGSRGGRRQVVILEPSELSAKRIDFLNVRGIAASGTEYRSEKTHLLVRRAVRPALSS